jgi:hypothetical protein
LKRKCMNKMVGQKGRKNRNDGRLAWTPQQKSRLYKSF